jgi:AraC family transcriptional regulator
MHRVLEYVDQHLDERLDLETLAGEANFSRFHFHRLFAAMTGETIGDYIRRRRLETAAIRLASQPDLRVVEVALAVGFASTEAFTRAFKAHFGDPPAAWRSAARRQREKSNRGQSKRKGGQAFAAGGRHHGGDSHEERSMSMTAKLVDRQPVHVAYLRYEGPFGAAVSEFWQHTVYPWMVANDLVGRTRFGISRDDPAVTAPDRCRYDAAVEVPADFRGAGKHLCTTLPGGKYAAARFSGTVDQIADAWASLLRDWLPESNLQLDARPFFEHYPPTSSYDPKTGVFECELCIPVSPL